MLQFASGEKQQTLEVHGITVTEPPYHSFVVYGYEDRFKMNVAQYKQTGSWYWQTDGIELYQDSTMKNSFVHSNDDVLKLYGPIPDRFPPSKLRGNSGGGAQE